MRTGLCLHMFGYKKEGHNLLHDSLVSPTYSNIYKNVSLVVPDGFS